MTDTANKPPLPSAGDKPAGVAMRTAREWREVYTTYPPLRKALLLTGKVGMLLVIALCLGLALFAPPAVLNNHPGLMAYVNFMAGHFRTVRTLSVGALYPQVSQLVLAVGWGTVLIPFVALLLHTVIYVLVLDYPATKANIAVRYETYVIHRGILMEILVVPGFTFMVVFALLGDLGFTHAFGLINGAGMTKAENLDGNFVSRFDMLMYTSRWGLGIVAPSIMIMGIGLYSFLSPGLIFVIPLWLGNMRRRLTGWRVK